MKGLMDEAARILLDFFEKHHVKAGVVAGFHTLDYPRASHIFPHGQNKLIDLLLQLAKERHSFFRNMCHHHKVDRHHCD